MCLNLFLVFSAVFSFSVSSLASSNKLQLTLENFLEQVKENHQGFKASQNLSQGALERSQEGGLLLSPTFFTAAQLSSDAKKNPLFAYDKVALNTYSLGLSQTFLSGTQIKLSYNLNYTNYVGLAPPFFEGKPMFELTQPLWRNSFGSETRRAQEVLESGALATHFGESYKLKLILSDAESTYWRLVLARQNVKTQEEGVSRAEKIYKWSSNRSRYRLADESDTLQAQAALEVRKLQLQAAQDEEKSASRAFNQARQTPPLQTTNDNTVSESLAELDSEKIKLLDIPKRTDIREDTKAAEQFERASVANALSALERDSPTFDLYASYALNSKTATQGSAISDSFKTDQPTRAVGIRLIAPLDIFLLSKIRGGWQKERSGAELAYQRKLYEQEQDWTDWTRKFQEAKTRFQLSLSIEEIQKKKFFYEKERLGRGRSTTYQVLVFEQDFAQAQISRMQAQTEILQLYARLKLFGDGS